MVILYTITVGFPAFLTGFFIVERVKIVMVLATKVKSFLALPFTTKPRASRYE